MKEPRQAKLTAMAECGEVGCGRWNQFRKIQIHLLPTSLPPPRVVFISRFINLISRQSSCFLLALGGTGWVGLGLGRRANSANDKFTPAAFSCRANKILSLPLHLTLLRFSPHRPPPSCRAQSLSSGPVDNVCLRFCLRQRLPTCLAIPLWSTIVCACVRELPVCRVRRSESVVT